MTDKWAPVRSKERDGASVTEGGDRQVLNSKLVKPGMISHDNSIEMKCFQSLDLLRTMSESTE